MTILGTLYKFNWNSSEDCEKWAQKLAKVITEIILHDSVMHIWLQGNLGAGKTTFIRYLLKALGHQGKVKSPSYSLCEPYEIEVGQYSFAIHHFDLYRMRHAREWEDSGSKDLLTSPGINLIEWLEKAENTLPTPCLQISIEYLNENQRFGTFIASNLLGQIIINPFSNGS